MNHEKKKSFADHHMIYHKVKQAAKSVHKWTHKYPRTTKALVSAAGNLAGAAVVHHLTKDK